MALQSQFSLAPEEKLVAIDSKKGKLYIGIPREKSFQEKRISLVPESVSILTSRGHKVIVESRAGEGSRFSDKDYSEAGAQIVYDTKAVFDAEIVVKSAPISEEEIDYCKPGQVVISPIHLPAMKESLLKKMIERKIIGLAFEYISDESNAFPIVRSMSEIAGNQSIHIASELLSSVKNGLGLMLGGISGVAPTKIIILGAGTVAEFAARTALSLGSQVKVFDNSVYKLKRLQNLLGERIYTSVLYPNVLERELQWADVVIGAMHSQEGRSPILITEEMVSGMKAGAVIIDVSIDQGGCFETSEVTTHDNPVFIKYDVIHYCVPNIAARVSRTASYAISSVISPMLIKASESYGMDGLIHASQMTRHSVYLYKGVLTNKHLAERYSLRYTSLDLLLGEIY